MSANEVQIYTLLFPDGEWGETATATDLDSVVSQLSPNISFSQDIGQNLQTLSTQNADTSGVANGFLYVPDLNPSDACYNISKEYIPKNVTRQANLPPTDFTLIALAPWISVECTQSYLKSARSDPNKGFIFYLPDNSTESPPSPSSSVWDLQDGGAWKTKNMYPVYVIPGLLGQELMHQLGLYSGNMTSVPNGHDISALPGADPRDYVRLYTEIDTANLSTLPSFWIMIVVVVAVLVTILGLTSACMHLTQKRGRRSLRLRVESGDVNLETLGIKRFTIPQSTLERLPLFIYNDESGIPHPMSPREIKTDEVSADAKDTLEVSSDAKMGLQPSAVHSVIALSQDQNIDDELDPGDDLPHKFLPYAQPACPICLDDYVSGDTEIRELPCGHIYHPECIDTYLGTQSSLCPLCKQCALPPGYCPVRITNAMVRKERNLRRLRHRSENDDAEAGNGVQETWNRVRDLGTRLKSPSMAAPRELLVLGEPLRSPVGSILARSQPAVLNHETHAATQSRQDWVEARIREVAARQTPIQNTDDTSRRPRPKWRENVSKVFPGFV